MSRSAILFVTSSLVFGSLFLSYESSQAIETAPGSQVVAQVQDQTLTKSALDQMFSASVNSGLARIPTREELREQWIHHQVAAIEARKLKLQEKPETLQKINAILHDALLVQQLGSAIQKITVTAKEAQDFYSKYPEIKIAHIFVPAPKGTTEEAEKTALAILTSAQKEFLEEKKMSFAEVAARVSHSASASVGGELDFQTEEDLDPALYAAARKMRSGEVSGPIRSESGFHLVKFLATRPFSEVNLTLLLQRAMRAKRDALVKEYLETLKKKASVKSIGKV